MTLHAEDLSHIYLKGTPMQRVALAGVSLTLAPGECVAVVGVSGSGKSTLARILAGLTPPTGGCVLLDGKDITAAPLLGAWGRRLRALGRWLRVTFAPRAWLHRRHWTIQRWRRGGPRQPQLPPSRPVVLAFQNPEDQFFSATVLEEVGVGLTPPLPPAAPPPRTLPGGIVLHDRTRRPETPRVVLEALHTVELDPDVYGQRDPFTLSGGEQRRLALAVLLAREPRVLILDEPSAGLDDPGRARLYACIERVRREQGTAVLLVSHDLEEVAAVAERVIVLGDGRVAAEGPPAAVLQDTTILAAAGLTPPPLVRLRADLAARGHDLPGDWTGVTGAAAALTPALMGGGGDGDA